MKRFRSLLVTFALASVGSSMASPADLLQSGPMLGYSEHREVLLWAQTKEAASVRFEYWETSAPQKRFSTETAKTEKDHGFTAKLIADQVVPGSEYDYEILINDKKVERPYPLHFQTQKIWRYRGDPPDFKVAVGSCLFINDKPYDRPGRPYGGNPDILQAIHQKRPDAMLWLGDNIYLREADWNTRTGILYRYTHMRSLEDLQPLLASTHHYAIWDDHDFGPNNADRSFWNKEATWQAFQDFWGNPCYGVNGQKGITSTFEWGDAQFFLMDNRYFRTPNYRISEDGAFLGEEQLQWLIDALSSSQATFRIVAVGSTVLNPVDSSDNYAAFPAERDRLLRLIRQENIPGVVFLSGDIHFSEMTSMTRYATYPLYEFTVSPFTSGISNMARNSNNYLRDPSSVVAEHNFGLLEFSGPTNDRKMKVSFNGRTGEELWSKTISAKELSVTPARSENARAPRSRDTATTTPKTGD
ncbi:MAG: alkaline phosphatase family protein [Candidatus Sumerlaeaceae bacterium]|nr:alkaline phosphatase family protein [Candidatus Sumerlaeaceae bacterium]